MAIKFFLYAVTAVLLLSHASAYIDPGTGASIIGSIWPALVAILSGIGAFFVRKFWRPILGIFKKES